MCACAVKRQNAYFGVFLIHQQPVGVDVAFTIALIVAVKSMITAVLVKWFVVGKLLHDIKRSLSIRPRFLASFRSRRNCLVGFTSYLAIAYHISSAHFLNSSKLPVKAIPLPLRASSIAFMVELLRYLPVSGS